MINKFDLHTNFKLLRDLIKAINEFKYSAGKPGFLPPVKACNVELYIHDLVLILLIYKKEFPNKFNDLITDTKFRPIKLDQDLAGTIYYSNKGGYKLEDQSHLEKYIESFSGLVYDYDPEFIFSENINLIVECWNTIIDKFSFQSVEKNSGFKNELVIILEKFKIEDLEKNLENYALQIISNKKERFERIPKIDEKSSIANIIESTNNKVNKEICLDPFLFGNIKNKNINCHFTIPELMMLSDSLRFNSDFILSKIYNIDIDSILLFGGELKKNWDFMGGVTNPVRIFKLDNSIASQFDVIALDARTIIDNYRRGRPDAIRRTIPGFFDSFFKKLNKGGKLVLIFNHFVNTHKRILEKYDKNLEKIIKLANKTIIVLSKEELKDLAYFNGEDIIKDYDTKFRDSNRKQNDYVKLIKEILLPKGEFWRYISKHDWSVNYNKSYNLKKLFIPNLEGVELRSFAKYTETSRSNPKKNDIIINISSLGKIPGDLDLTQRVYYAKKINKCLKLEKSSLLISLVGELKPTRFIYDGFPIFLMPGVLPLEINDSKVSEEFIMFALRSNSIKAQLKYLNTGSTIPRFNKDDILDLKIKIAENKIIAGNIINEQRQNIFKELKVDKLLKETQKERFKKIRNISHDMGDYFTNIFPNIDMLMETIINKKDDEINDFFGDKTLNLVKNFKILQKDIESLSELNQQFKEGLNYDKKYPLTLYNVKDIYKMTENLLRKTKSKFFSTYTEIIMEDLMTGDKELDQKDIKKYEYDKLGYKINDKAFEKFIKQFITNTTKHAGFLEKTKKQNKFKIQFSFNGLNLDIKIMNNGKPFKSNWTKEKFIKYGETTNTKLGQGSGGEIINDIANYFQINDWYINWNSDSEYPVQFIFPLSLEPIE